MIPYGRQDINQDDVDAVIEVLESDFITTGPNVSDFEAALQKRFSVRHAITANSATSSLHLACMALNLSRGDILWTSPISFVASANCALYCGATVDFVDIDPETFNMCPMSLEDKLREADKARALPKIIVLVHMCGQPTHIKEISALCRRYGVALIEDASHAVGATYEDKPVGACAHSDITVFSFHPVKIITTGEGGAATTNQADLASRMSLLRSHGITRDPAELQKPNQGGWYYEQLMLGFNFRMTDLQAALGLSQLKRLDRFLERRRDLVTAYAERLKSAPVVLPREQSGSKSSWHLYVVRMTEKDNGEARRFVYDSMRERGIGVNVHYIPIHLQPYYRKLGFCPDQFPAALDYYNRSLSIPLSFALTDAEHEYVCSSIIEVLNLYAK